VVAHDEGDDARAEALAEESLALRRTGGDRWGAAYTLRVLADIARDRGEHARAEGLYRESLALLGQATDALSVAACLEGLAVAAWESGKLERAAELHGVAAALRAAADTPLPPPDRARYEPVIAAIRTALGDHRFDAARARGQALSLEQAVARAREDTPRAERAAPLVYNL